MIVIRNDLLLKWNSCIVAFRYPYLGRFVIVYRV